MYPVLVMEYTCYSRRQKRRWIHIEAVVNLAMVSDREMIAAACRRSLKEDFQLPFGLPL